MRCEDREIDLRRSEGERERECEVRKIIKKRLKDRNKDKKIKARKKTMF